MDSGSTIKLEHIQQRVEATDADLSDSVVAGVCLARTTLRDVDLTGMQVTDPDLSGSRVANADLSALHIRNANLTGVTIYDCNLNGMTIDGIAVTEMLEAYKALRCRKAAESA